MAETAVTVEPALADEALIERLQALVDPLGGLIGAARFADHRPGGPDYHLCISHLGDFTAALPGVTRPALRPARGAIDGSGGGTDGSDAYVRAVAEAVERYSSCTFEDEQLLLATADDLGDDALDLDLLPRCSPAELAHPRCLVRTPDKSTLIRWVRGVDLMRNAAIWIPAVLVYLHLPLRSAAESITVPTSTGCAAHSDLHSALVRGLCEVIERDAVALTWLHRLPLPGLDPSGVPDLGRWTDRHGATTVQTRLFDATTDIGIPVIYALTCEPHHPRVRNVVAAACDLSPARATAKALREAESCRVAIESAVGSEAAPDDFVDALEGGRYMAHPSRSGAFSFLQESGPDRRLADMADLTGPDHRQDLETVLAALRAAGHGAYAVELTGEEARRAGLRCVRALVPGLQPVSFATRTRFLAHPRVTVGPRRMGLPSRAERDLNPLPQPFA